MRFATSALTFTLIILGFFQGFSEEDKKGEVIQFSGILLDGETEEPISFATVFIKKENRGTITNLDGFFSFAVREGDTVIMRSIGYKQKELVIPYRTKKKSYSIIERLERDTLVLSEVVVYPWPSKQLLRQAIINLEVPDDLVELAKKNFEDANLKDFNLITNYDGNENFDQFVKNYVGEVYYQGQSAPIHLMNPFAWAQFFQAVKRGDFRRKD